MFTIEGEEEDDESGTEDDGDKEREEDDGPQPIGAIGPASEVRAIDHDEFTIDGDTADEIVDDQGGDRLEAIDQQTDGGFDEGIEGAIHRE